MEAIEAISRWHDKLQVTAKMVIIDTITRIRPQGIPNKGAYQADAQALARSLAGRMHPGFKGSSQRLPASIVAPRQRLRRVFSSQGSFAVWH